MRQTLQSKLAILIILINIITFTQTSFTVNVSDKNINAITSYTWNIHYSSTYVINIPITFSFPTRIRVQGNFTLTYDGQPVNASNTTINSITILKPNINTSSVLIVNSVKNPLSASDETKFSIEANGELDATMNNSFIKFTKGVITLCEWAFQGSTGQLDSSVNLTIKNTNPILHNSIISVSYPLTYQERKNYQVKTLSTPLSCKVYNSKVQLNSDCSEESNKIVITLNTNASINSQSNISIILQGINNPPTEQSIGTDFHITTKQSENDIDSTSSCSILKTNSRIINGSFTISNQQINTDYLDARIQLTGNMTFLKDDTLNIINATEMNLCQNNLYFKYNDKFTEWNKKDSIYTYNSSQKDLGDGSIEINMKCTILTPNSQKPVFYQFHFQSSSSTYLKIRAQLKAVAKQFSSSALNIESQNRTMLALTSYIVNIQIGSILSSNFKIQILFDSSSSLTNFKNLCSINDTNASCTASSNKIIINSNILQQIAVKTVLKIIIYNITNPSQPNPSSFQISTFYNSTQSQNKVQYGLILGEFYKSIYVGASISPSVFKVYQRATININLKTLIISIPSNATYTIIFPSQVSQISLISIEINTNIRTDVQFRLGNLNQSIMFQLNSQLSLNSNMTITLKINAPIYIGTYQSLQFYTNDSTYGYLYNKQNMQISINQSATSSVGIVKSNSQTGVWNAYKFSISTQFKHPNKFKLQIQVPSDIQLNQSSLSCQTCNLIFQKPVLTLEIQGDQSLSFTVIISDFKNPRITGQSQQWLFTTMTILDQVISIGNSSVQIQNPNKLTSLFYSNDSYYNENINPVIIQISPFNQFQLQDYLIISLNNIYTEQANKKLNCSGLQASCSFINQTIRVLINTTGKILNLVINNLISSTLRYNVTKSLDIKSYNKNGKQIDQGEILYQVSCAQNYQTYQCKICNSNHACLTCYTNWTLLNDKCVNNCGTLTKFQNYDNNGVCQLCLYPCLTCKSVSECITCNITSQKFYLHDNSSCEKFCQLDSGYFTYTYKGTNVCESCNEVNCTSCINNTYCSNCAGSYLFEGKCVNQCPVNSYEQQNQCKACDKNCFICNGPLRSNCINCTSGAFNTSYGCISNCSDINLALLSSLTCGCTSSCIECRYNESTYCLACDTVSNFSLTSSGQCLQKCPEGTYQNNHKCISCEFGCVNCTELYCYSCLPNLKSYLNKCYQSCDVLGQQYDVSGQSCVLCSDGCSSCSQSSTCLTCKNGYQLIGTSCVIVNQNILPLPTIICSSVWVGIIIIAKVILIKPYVPYCFLTGCSVIQTILIYILLIISSSNVITSRLLQTTQSYLSLVFILLITSLVLNYLQNILYLIIFYRYLKPLIHNPRQIDYITHGSILLIATLTNYRFGLIIFSQLCSKPRIEIQNSSQLTPVHYLCSLSIVLTIIPLSCSGILLYNSVPLSTFFMLSIDLLLLCIFNIICSIWMLSCSKDESYFSSSIKKYQIEDNFRTQFPIILDDDKNVSREILKSNKNNKNIQQKSELALNQEKFDYPYNKFHQKQKFYNHQTDNQPLPIIVNAKEKPIEDTQHQNQPQRNLQISQYKKQDQLALSKGRGRRKQIDNKNLTKSNKGTLNNNKQISKSHRYRKQSFEDSQLCKKDINKQKKVEEQKSIQIQNIDLSEESKMPQKVSVFQSNQKLIKPHKIGAQSVNPKQPEKGMKKTQIRVFQSQKDGTSQGIDDLDIDGIIQSKIMVMDLKNFEDSTPNNMTQEMNYDDISPSFFNIQNQRFDIENLEDQNP